MALAAMGLHRVLSCRANAAHDVHFVCYCLKVGRIYATHHAAKMIQVKAGGDWSLLQLISEAVRVYEFALAPVTVDADHAITGRVLRSGPQPARVRLVDARPEVFNVVLMLVV